MQEEEGLEKEREQDESGGETKRREI